MLWQKFYGSLVPHELDRFGPIMFAVNCGQKIHDILNDNLRNSKIITTIRDPRETVHSFHRFMQCDFERAVSAGAAVHKYVLSYKKFQSPVLFARCSSGSRNCSRTCFKLAFFIFIQALIATNQTESQTVSR